MRVSSLRTLPVGLDHADPDFSYVGSGSKRATTAVIGYTGSSRGLSASRQLESIGQRLPRHDARPVQHRAGDFPCFDVHPQRVGTGLKFGGSLGCWR